VFYKYAYYIEIFTVIKTYSREKISRTRIISIIS